jgi:hypothetical protein
MKSALRELEMASAALTEIGIENLHQAEAALDRRSQAIAAVAELAGRLPLNPSERDDTLGTLRLVSDAGRQAQQRIAALRTAAVGELDQWTRIYRALSGAGASVKRIDVSG